MNEGMVIKATTTQAKSLAQIKSLGYSEEEVVEVFNRYMEWRRQQTKYRQGQLEKQKLLRKLLRERPELLEGVGENEKEGEKSLRRDGRNQ